MLKTIETLSLAYYSEKQNQVKARFNNKSDIEYNNLKFYI